MQLENQFIKEMSDGELQQAAANLEDFTDTGKMRVQSELRLRRLSAAPKTAPSTSSLSPTADDDDSDSSWVPFFTYLFAFIIGAFVMWKICGNMDLALVGAMMGIVIVQIIASRKHNSRPSQSTDMVDNWFLYDFNDDTPGNDGEFGDGDFFGGFDGGFDGGD